MRIIFLIVSFLFITKSNACLNGETRVLKNGFLLFEDYEGIVPQGHNFNLNNSSKLLSELDQLYKQTNNLDYLSDKGYVLIVLKRYHEALKLYQDIEQKSPNRYSTASNIATIYELIGDNVNALNWIKKAIQINPKSHNSSEWLHQKILEAKIKGENYYTSEFLLNINFGNDIQPKTQLNTKRKQELISALYYQLNERISFIKSEDKIIAILLNDLASLAWLTSDFIGSIDILKLAKTYGINPNQANKKIEVLNYEIQSDLRNDLYELSIHNEYHKNVILVLSLLLTASIITIILILIEKK